MARVASYDVEGVIVIAVDGAYHLLLLRKALRSRSCAVGAFEQGLSARGRRLASWVWSEIAISARPRCHRDGAALLVGA